jgi:hypothetical protein
MKASQCHHFYCDMNFTQENLVIFIMVYLGLILLFSVSVRVRNWQPFKSRGLIMIFGLGIEIIEGFGSLIPYIFSVEFAYNYEIFFYVFVMTPLKTTGYFLIQAVFHFH